MIDKTSIKIYPSQKHPTPSGVSQSSEFKVQCSNVALLNSPPATNGGESEMAELWGNKKPPKRYFLFFCGGDDNRFCSLVRFRF